MTEPQPKPYNGIRAQGEQDRTQEYKEVREVFVSQVNDFLSRMADLQQQVTGVKTPNNYTFAIEEEPVLTETFLGISANGRTHTVARNRRPGISLFGDGTTTPRVFQAVVPNETGGTSIIEMVGPDPLQIKTENDAIVYDPKSQGTATRLTLVTEKVTEDSRITTEEQYEVYGNGRISAVTGQEIPVGVSYQQAQLDSFRVATMVVAELAETFGS